MTQAAWEEMAQTVKTLDLRLRRVEETLNLAAIDRPKPEIIQVPEALPKPLVVMEDEPQPRHALAEAKERMGEGDAAPTDAEQHSNDGINIGRILNVSGVCFFVIGIALGIMYAWHYMGAPFKIFLGLLTAAAMVFGGEVLSRRESNKWYGQGLIAGGYSLGYFAIYAMHHVESVRILASASVDIVLLIAVAIGCMTHAICKRSETVASLSTLLAFVTLSLSTVTGFTALAAGAFSVGLAAVIAYMRWHNMFVLSVLGSYLTYAFYIEPHVLQANPEPLGYFLVSAAFYGTYWAANNVVTYLLADKKEHEGTLLTMAVINAIAFVALGLHSLSHAALEPWRFFFLFITGGAYMWMAPFISGRNEKLAINSTITGLVLATAAIPLKLDNHATAAVWLMEVALLAYIGLQNNLIALRWFALVLGSVLTLGMFNIAADTSVISVLGCDVQIRVILAAFGVMSFAVTSSCYRTEEFRGNLRTYEEGWDKPYYLFAVFTAWLISVNAVPPEILPLVLALEGAFLLAIGEPGIALLHHVCAVGFVISGMVQVFSNVPTLAAWAATLPLGLAIGGVYRFAKLHEDHEVSRAFERIYVIGTALVATIVSAQHFHATGLSIALAAEGVALIAIGFKLPDRAYRATGLTFFALLACKLFIYDLAGETMIQRIISFFVAGIAYLIGSYAYAWFSSIFAPTGGLAKNAAAEPPR